MQIALFELLFLLLYCVYRCLYLAARNLRTPL